MIGFTEYANFGYAIGTTRTYSSLITHSVRNICFAYYRNFNSMKEISTSEHESDCGPFLRWEQLRLLYNLVLIVLVVAYLSLVNPSRLSDTNFVFWLCKTGLVLNIAFFSGALVESLFNSLGLKSIWLTSTLFMSGLFLSSFSMLILLFSFEFRNAML